jgi:hypothetical protein
MGGTGGALGTGHQHHNRNHNSNQSANMIMRGVGGANIMNYSILQSELEQDTGSLEDMHMFFVAFNQRQNKLLAMLEKQDMVQKSNDRQNLLYINDDVINDSPIQNNKIALSQHMSDTNRVPKEKIPFSPKHPMNVILLRKEVDLE